MKIILRVDNSSILDFHYLYFSIIPGIITTYEFQYNLPTQSIVVGWSNCISKFAEITTGYDEHIVDFSSRDFTK